MSWDPWEPRVGRDEPVQEGQEGYGPGIRQGVGLGLGAEFLNDRLTGLGPQAPLGNLHSQEQCFIKTGKIIEEKCTCQGAGIYRNGPAWTQGLRMDCGAGEKGGWGYRGDMQGADLLARPPKCPPRPEGGFQEALGGAWTQ